MTLVRHKFIQSLPSTLSTVLADQQDLTLSQMKISAASIAAAFLDECISLVGVPFYVVTDRGTQFESEL